MHAEAENISQENLGCFLAAFYARARADEMLGPVFSAAIADDRWPHHLERIHAFWSSAMLGTRRYQGNPFGAHLQLDLVPAHFDRWLALFRETAHEFYAQDPAAMLIGKAGRIAESLKAGLFFRPH